MAEILVVGKLRPYHGVAVRFAKVKIFNQARRTKEESVCESKGKRE